MFTDPSKVIETWDIRPGTKIADLGCGSGHYSVAIAKRIGKEGRVYSFDIMQEMISALKSRAAGEHISNIESRCVDLEKEKGTQLIDDMIDFAVIANTLFQFEDKKALLREAHRILRNGGIVAVVDWNMSDSPLGPPKEHRIDKDSAVNLFTEAGFVFIKEFSVDDFHYGVMFKKS